MNKTKIFIIVALAITGACALFGMYQFKPDATLLHTVHDARSGKTIVIKRITDNFDESEPGFRASILKLSKDHPRTMDEAIRYFSTIDAVAKASFDYEKKEFETKNPAAYFIKAVIDEKSVGYASFEIQPDSSAYMRQLTVDPDYQGMGIGKYLTYAIFSARPEVTTITLVTNRNDISAIGFYKHLGFVEVPVTPHKEFNPDPKLWMGLKFTKNNNKKG